MWREISSCHLHAIIEHDSRFITLKYPQIINSIKVMPGKHKKNFVLANEFVARILLVSFVDLHAS